MFVAYMNENMSKQWLVEAKDAAMKWNINGHAVPWSQYFPLPHTAKIHTYDQN